MIHAQADSFPMKDDIQAIGLYALMQKILNMK